jgi:lambda repressor-like predicted transcriptional regulator
MSLLPPISNNPNSRERSLWAQAELKRIGSSLAEIARENGWSRPCVSNAMFRAADPQERAIAAKLGVTQQQLFPERFNPQGKRLHRVKNSAPITAHNVKSGQAA